MFATFTNVQPSIIRKNDTFSVPYPDGYDAAYFTTANAVMHVQAQQSLYDIDEGFEATLGTSNITITYLGETPIPANTLINFQFDLSETEDVAAAAPGSMWVNIDTPPPNIQRIADRLFVGDATRMGNARSNTNDTWLSDASVGANWIPRDSQFISMANRGTIAVAGASRASDNDDVPSSAAAIGVAGAVIVDSGVSRSGWGLYSDVQFESGTYGYGLEIAVKNRGDNHSSTPYFMTEGTYGIWLPGGGDASYGGSPTNPNNTAIAIGSGASTWNRGIVFEADALTGVDISGLSGTAVAIGLGTRHLLSWYSPDNAQGAFIYSSVFTNGKDVGIQFANDQIRFQGTGNADLVRFSHQANGVNYVDVWNAPVGSAPGLHAAGPDTDIDVGVTTKGMGVLALSYASVAASVAANFTADKVIPIKVGGTTLYIPGRTTSW